MTFGLSFAKIVLNFMGRRTVTVSPGLHLRDKRAYVPGLIATFRGLSPLTAISALYVHDGMRTLMVHSLLWLEPPISRVVVSLRGNAVVWVTVTPRCIHRNSDGANKFTNRVELSVPW